MAISSAVDASAVARVLGVSTIFKNLRGGSIVYLPQRVALVGQGATASTFSTAKAVVTSAYEVGYNYGFGSPLHLAALQLLPPNGDGLGSVPLTVYPLEDAGTGVAAAGDITPSGTQTEAAQYRVKCNNIYSEYFTISAAQTVADTVTAITTAINAVPEFPMTAVDSTTTCDVTAKWAGTSGNDLYLEVEGSTTAGTTFAFTQPTGGLVNPDASDALDLVGTAWETMVVNCFEDTDTTNIDAYNTWAEARWGALVRKPCMVFTGQNGTPDDTVPEARTTQRTNCFITEPGGVDLPLVIAARAVARIARQANNNPPVDYARLALTGLTPGLDSAQLTYTQRDAAVKAGLSTTTSDGTVVYLSDTVTFYRPSGDTTPAYRYVVDIVKLQNILFNLDLIFNTAEWDGAPLIPDDQPTNNPAAKKPRMAKAAVCSLIDSLALEAMISDPETAKESVQCEISSSNPKRLDIAFTLQLSGNANIISIDFNFGFYFG